MEKIIALLDQTASGAYGMSSFVTEDDTGAISVHDVRGGRQPLTAAALAEQCRLGLAIDVREAGGFVASNAAGRVAMWLGNAFESQCERRGAPSPETPLQISPDGSLFVLPGRGVFWVEPLLAARAALTDWNSRAAAAAFAAHKADRDRAAGIADLMDRAVPFEYLTVAARWWTRATPEAQEQVLEQWIRARSLAEGTPLDRDQVLGTIRGILDVSVSRRNSGE